MDFDEAVTAHASWKAKLKTYVQRPDKSLNPNTVAMDNQCKLGQWIYADGAKYSALAEFTELKNQHANFHRTAADLIRRADAGENIYAGGALGATSPFSTLSGKVIELIVKIKEKVK